MTHNRVRGVHLAQSQYLEILENNYVEKMSKGIQLFPYPSMNMKHTPKWPNLVVYRHLLKDLIDYSNGEGILQVVWHKSLVTFFFQNGRHHFHEKLSRKAHTGSGS